MRTLAIGDIHGFFRALRALEAFVPFRPDDTLITLGDYVDRGPNSCAVLDWLVARRAGGNLIALRGNHELMMLAARDGEGDLRTWIECGGDAALASYSPFGDKGRFADIPDSHWEFLESATVPYAQSATHFFVHANTFPECPLDEQPDLMLYWAAFNDPPPHESGKVMVCGHTPQRSGVPRNLGHAVCIDTGACRGGWLTCLDVATGRYWQANEKGQTRDGWLE